MKTTVLVGFISILLLGSLGSLIYFHVSTSKSEVTNQNSSYSGNRVTDAIKSQANTHDMMRLIREQNDTISRMAKLLELAVDSHEAEPENKNDQIVKANLLHHYNLMISQKDQEIANLKSKVSSSQSMSPTLSSSTSMQYRYAPQSGRVGEECEMKYGYSLVEEWRKSKQNVV